MNRVKNQNLILFASVLYYAGAFIGESFSGGSLIMAAAIGLLAVAYLSNTKGIVRMKRRGFIVYVLTFLLFCVASKLWAENPSLATGKINSLIFILIGMIVIHLCYPEYASIEDLLKVIMYGGYVVVMYAFFRYGVRGVLTLATNNTRISSSVLNANTLGMCAAYAIVINTYFILYGRLGLRDVLILPAAALLLVSHSRKAIILVTLGITGIYILKNVNKKNFGMTVLKLLVGLIVLLLAFFILSRLSFTQSIIKRMLAVVEMLEGTGKRSTNSAWIRFAYIRLGMQIFRENPVLGIGIGNATIYTQLYYGHNHYLHNNYVELLACGGIVGFMVYYSMHLYLIRNYMKLRSYRDREYDICLVLLVLNLIMDYGFVSYYDKSNYLFLFMLWLKITSMKRNVHENRALRNLGKPANREVLT